MRIVDAFNVEAEESRLRAVSTESRFDAIRESRIVFPFAKL